MDLRRYRPLKETKFDGSRSGKNFTIDRQIEPLVIPSEITGLDDRHAFLKLGNNVARFDFDYIDLEANTAPFIPRNSEDDRLRFDRRTFLPLSPELYEKDSEEEPKATVEEAEAPTPDAVPESQSAPLAHAKRQVPIPWPDRSGLDPASAGEENRPAPENQMSAGPIALIAEVHAHAPKHGEHQLDLSLEP
jgi:hypothetical protein